MVYLSTSLPPSARSGSPRDLAANSPTISSKGALAHHLSLYIPVFHSQRSCVPTVHQPVPSSPAVGTTLDPLARTCIFATVPLTTERPIALRHRLHRVPSAYAPGVHPVRSGAAGHRSRWRERRPHASPVTFKRCAGRFPVRLSGRRLGGRSSLREDPSRRCTDVFAALECGTGESCNTLLTSIWPGEAVGCPVRQASRV